MCGERNEHGLKAQFFLHGDRAVSSISAREMFEGYKDIFHGGILSTMLDEVMIKAILARNVFAVTAELIVKFLRPVRTGEQLTFSGWIVRSRGRLYVTAGEAVGKNGAVYATAAGKYVEAGDALKKQLLASLD